MAHLAWTRQPRGRGNGGSYPCSAYDHINRPHHSSDWFFSREYPGAVWWSQINTATAPDSFLVCQLNFMRFLPLIIHNSSWFRRDRKPSFHSGTEQTPVEGKKYISLTKTSNALQKCVSCNLIQFSTIAFGTHSPCPPQLLHTCVRVRLSVGWLD